MKIKIIEVKSEIGAGTRGASLGVEAIKIASLDMKSDFFRTHETVEVENVNELLFNSAEHAYAKFIDGVLIMEERVCLEVYEQIWDDFFPIIMAGDHSTAYGTIAGIKKAYTLFHDEDTVDEFGVSVFGAIEEEFVDVLHLDRFVRPEKI